MSMDDESDSDELERLAERVRVLDAALTQLLEVVRDVITDGDVEPGLLALAKKALAEAEEVSAG